MLRYILMKTPSVGEIFAWQVSGAGAL